MFSKETMGFPGKRPEGATDNSKYYRSRSSSLLTPLHRVLCHTCHMLLQSFTGWHQHVPWSKNMMSSTCPPTHRFKKDKIPKRFSLIWHLPFIKASREKRIQFMLPKGFPTSNPLQGIRLVNKLKRPVIHAMMAFG